MRHQIAKKVPSICFVYVLTILAGFSVGCVKKQASRSHTKLVNGQVIGTDVAPAAIRISSELPSKNGTVGLHNYAKCTASWVSHNTVMTAAHCITENGLALPKVSIDHGTGKGLETTKVYPNANYDDRSAGYDVALLVFPDNSIDESKAAKMASSTPKVGDTITIIGYGNFNHTQQSGSGKRRMGESVISDINRTFDFVGAPQPEGEGTGKRVLNSQGDSGGPMFLGGPAEQVIIGVSSTVDGEPQKNGDYAGHYTNLFIPNNLDWLNKMVKEGKARILGLDGAQAMNNADQVRPITPNSDDGQINGGGGNNGGGDGQINGGGDGQINGGGGGQINGGGGGQINGGGGGQINGGGGGTAGCKCGPVNGKCTVTQNGQVVASGDIPSDDPTCQKTVCGPGQVLGSFCSK